MERNKTHTIKLGVFVTMGILVFIGGIYLIGRGQNLFGSNIHISSTFTDVSGLQAGNNVCFSGINIGTVEDIQIITDSTAQVDMVIDEKVKKFIKVDSKTVIGSEGLMGNKTINILPGLRSSATISDKAVLASTRTFDYEAILRQLKKTTDNASMITYDLAGIMHSVSSGSGTLGKLIKDSTMANNFAASLVNLRMASHGLTQTVNNFTEGTSGLKGTMSTIQKGAEGFSENMEAAKHNFLLKGYFKKKDKELQDSIKKAKQDSLNNSK